MRSVPYINMHLNSQAIITYVKKESDPIYTQSTHISWHFAAFFQ
jgi:hypothetical protein